MYHGSETPGFFLKKPNPVAFGSFILFWALFGVGLNLVSVWVFWMSSDS